jgi:hypothetical protein
LDTHETNSEIPKQAEGFAAKKILPPKGSRPLETI